MPSWCRTCAAATRARAPFSRSRRRVRDGDDTLNWIARQPWSDGKVGMMGGSYVGIVQWKAALANNPHLKAIFPVVSGYDDYRDRYYSTGGALKLGNRLEWMAENLRAPGYHQDFGQFVLHLPVRSADMAALGWTSPMYREVIEHPTFDAFWRAISTKEHLDKVHVPVFSVGGWYDNFVQSDLEAFAALRKRSGVNRILVGPWAHNMSIPFEKVDLGTDSIVPVRALQMEWFDQWLMGKDSPLLSKPPVKIFVMGANMWREEQAWPPPEARQKVFYLESDGKANSPVGRRRAERQTGPQAGGRPVRLRPLQPRAHSRRLRLLQSESLPLGSHGPAFRGAAQGRPGLHHQASEARPRSHRQRAGCAVRRLQRARHGFHGEAGGRVPRRRSAQSDGRHSAPALSQFAGEAGTGHARRDLPRDGGRRSDQQRVPERPSHPPGDFEQQLSRASTAIRIPAGRWSRRPNSSKPARPSITTAPTPPAWS